MKAANVATFLGRKLHGNYEDEMGNNFSTRIEGTRIKHVMGPASIKMYDKRGILLRIETTANDVSFFKHHRKVEQRDGTTVRKVAPVKKSIYSLPDLRELMAAANGRYLAFISALEDPSAGTKALRRLADPAAENGRNYRGFNFFSKEDDLILAAVGRGEFTISGLRNKDLQRHLPGKKPAWTSRCLKRLRVHGLIKRVGFDGNRSGRVGSRAASGRNANCARFRVPAASASSTSRWISGASSATRTSPERESTTLPRASTSTTVGQARTECWCHTWKAASFTTGCSMPWRSTASRMAAVSFSAGNLAEWTPMTTKESGNCCWSRRNASTLWWQLIQQKVQNSSSTTLPRSSRMVRGRSVLSHSRSAGNSGAFTAARPVMGRSFRRTQRAGYASTVRASQR